MDACSVDAAYSLVDYLPRSSRARPWRAATDSGSAALTGAAGGRGSF